MHVSRFINRNVVAAADQLRARYCVAFTARARAITRTAPMGLLAAIVLALSGGISYAQEDDATSYCDRKLYWIDGGKVIRRANLDGSSIETIIVEPIDDPLDVAIDPVDKKIYWVNRSPVDLKIQRANLDGSDVENVVTTGYPHDIALDVNGRKLYWSDALRRTFYRANLDGSAMEVLFDTPNAGWSGTNGIALDLDAGSVYWTPDYTGWIQRADLDGSNAEMLVRDEQPFGIALDLEAGKMYWASLRRGMIRRTNLDGSGWETIVTNQDRVKRITIDSAAGKLIWTTPDAIRQANLDGSDVEELVTGLNDAGGITVDPTGGTLYWTDLHFDRILRSPRDGSGIETLVSATSIDIWGLAFDLAGAKLFWTDTTGGKILRGNFDGSEVQVVLGGLQSPRGITIDVLHPKMYWLEEGSQKLRRANLDGSEVEDIAITGPRASSLALDPTDQKVYWVDSLHKVRRANLDGSDVEEIASSYYTAGIALDVEAGKIYGAGGAIFRFDLDGSNFELLFGSQFHDPARITIDPIERKMYWMDFGDVSSIDGVAYICHANLDGSEHDCLPIWVVQWEWISPTESWYPAAIALIYDGSTLDCNANVIPDACNDGLSVDCDSNGAPDICEIADGLAVDCNHNWVPDDCDLAFGTSADVFPPLPRGPDGIPDECNSRTADPIDGPGVSDR